MAELTFEEAAEMVSMGCILDATDDDKLLLYGLYKVGSGTRPGSGWGVVHQAKVGAWERAVLACGNDPTCAQAHYASAVARLLP